jgi:hypothetical protein
MSKCRRQNIHEPFIRNSEGFFGGKNVQKGFRKADSNVQFLSIRLAAKAGVLGVYDLSGFLLKPHADAFYDIFN